MGFIPRKLFLFEVVKDSEVKDYAPCAKPCYIYCPDDCKDDSDLLHFSPPPPPPPPPSTHNTPSILLLMLCVLGFAFVFVSYLSIIRYRSSLRNSRRRNSLPVNDSREDFIDGNQGPVVDHPIWYIRTIGLQQSIIDSITVFKYRKGEGLVEGSDCSVCLSEFQDDENLRLLPKCSHAFHIHCIDTWLRSHKNCPLCRAPIVTDTNGARAISDESNVDNSSSSSGEENQLETVNNLGESDSDEDEDNGTRDTRANPRVVLPIEEENNVGNLEKNASCKRVERENKGRVRSDLAESCVKLEGEMEPMRRSISMDSSSASIVVSVITSSSAVKDAESSSTAYEGTSSHHMKPGTRNSSIYRLMKSSSFGRSLQKMPISVKRSISSGGKSSIPMHRGVKSEHLKH